MVVTLIAIAAALPLTMPAQAPAREVWSSASSATPASSPEAAEWDSLAHEQYAAGRYRESIASFERALQLGTDRPDVAALHIARAYARLDNRKQAKRWLELRALGRCAASLCGRCDACGAHLCGRAGSLRERPFAGGAQRRACAEPRSPSVTE